MGHHSRRQFRETCDESPDRVFGGALKVNLLSLVEPNSELLKKIADYPPLIWTSRMPCATAVRQKGVSDEDFDARWAAMCRKRSNLLKEVTIDFEYRWKFLRKVHWKGSGVRQARNQCGQCGSTESGGTGCGVDKQIESKWQISLSSGTPGPVAYRKGVLRRELAGIIGIDPGTQNPRRIDRMAKGRQSRVGT